MDAEKEKSTLIVDEDDILKMAEKIQKNTKADEIFSKALTNFLNTDKKINKSIVIGDTSNALAVSGANKKIDLIISPQTILKCMSKPNERYHGHNLSLEVMQQLPSELRNPTMIFSGNKEKSLVAITSLKDKENREIMVAVDLNSTDQRCEVNRISSAYGRNNMSNFLKKQIEQGHLIAANKEKANELFQSLGLQSPPEETFISYDNSIAYTVKNVKYPEEKNLDITDKESLETVCNKMQNWCGKVDEIAESQQEKSKEEVCI